MQHSIGLYSKRFYVSPSRSPQCKLYAIGMQISTSQHRLGFCNRRSRQSHFTLSFAPLRLILPFPGLRHFSCETPDPKWRVCKMRDIWYATRFPWGRYPIFANFSVLWWITYQLPPPCCYLQLLLINVD